MQKANLNRNWKYVHHNRKQSSDSMDISVASIQSSKSNKFNRFQFQKHEDPKLNSSHSEDQGQNLFELRGRTNKNEDFRTISRRNHDKDKLSNASVASDNQMVLQKNSKRLPNGFSIPLEKVKKIEKKGAKEMGNNLNIRDILWQVKTITTDFKRIIDLFGKKYRQIKNEWEVSFKLIMKMHLQQAGDQLKQNHLKIGQKIKQLEQISQVPITNSQAAIAQCKVNNLILQANDGTEKKAYLQLSKNNNQSMNVIKTVPSSQIEHNHLIASQQRQQGQFLSRQMHNLRKIILHMKQIMLQ